MSKAINDVTLGLDIKLELVKARRVSTVGDEIADLLSKNRLREAEVLMGEREERSRGTWKTLRKWINDPVPSRSLGWRLLEEMRTKTAVLQYEPAARQKRPACDKH